MSAALNMETESAPESSTLPSVTELGLVGEAMHSALVAACAALPSEREGNERESLAARMARKLAKVPPDSLRFIARAAGHAAKPSTRVIAAEGDASKRGAKRGGTATGRAHVECAIGKRATLQEVALAVVAGILRALSPGKASETTRDLRQLAAALLGASASPKGLSVAALRDCLTQAKADTKGDYQSPFADAVALLAAVSGESVLPGASLPGTTPKAKAPYGFVRDGDTFDVDAFALRFAPERRGVRPLLKALACEHFAGLTFTLGDLRGTVAPLTPADSETSN